MKKILLNALLIMNLLSTISCAAPSLNVKIFVPDSDAKAVVRTGQKVFYDSADFSKMICMYEDDFHALILSAKRVCQ